MKTYKNLIDSEYEVINDMGLAPIVGAMIEVLGIPQEINEFVGVPDCRRRVDTGTAIKALIINILYGRTPLVHVEHMFERLDCGVLFGEGLVSSDFNDDCLGKALDEIGNLDYHKLYSKLCIRGQEIHEVKTAGVHVDTTNISLYGDYDSSEAPDFKITYGDPKSKRKDLKQMNIGLFVEQNGLPIGGNALSGNKSDVKWFREALEELHELFCGDLETMPICVFDAAGSNEEMYQKANNLQVPTIIRQSDSFKMTEECINKAWADDEWVIVTKDGETLEKKPANNYYKLRNFDIKVNEHDWRLIVVYSSELQKLKESTSNRNFDKNREKILKNFKKLSTKAFESCEEANKEGENFVKHNIGITKPFKYSMNIKKVTIEKNAKRGNPGKSSEKTVIDKYYVEFELGERNEELYQEWLRQESCFVLVSNVPVSRKTYIELFCEYKNQWVVEEKFKFLKQPVVLGAIWLEKQERIKGLIFVLLLSVLVNMYICYRFMFLLKADEKSELNSALNHFEKTNPVAQSGDAESVLTTKVGNENTCVNNIEDNSKKNTNRHVGNNCKTNEHLYLQKINLENKLNVTYLKNSYGKIIKNMTFNTLRTLISPLKTVIKFNNHGNLYRKFAHDTSHNLLILITKIGFDPLIYVEKFTPKMDLWSFGSNVCKESMHNQTG